MVLLWKTLKWHRTTLAGCTSTWTLQATHPYPHADDHDEVSDNDGDIRCVVDGHRPGWGRVRRRNLHRWICSDAVNTQLIPLYAYLLMKVKRWNKKKTKQGTCLFKEETNRGHVKWLETNTLWSNVLRTQTFVPLRKGSQADSALTALNINIKLLENCSHY